MSELGTDVVESKTYVKEVFCSVRAVENGAFFDREVDMSQFKNLLEERLSETPLKIREQLKIPKLKLFAESEFFERVLAETGCEPKFEFETLDDLKREEIVGSDSS
jgi:hypothetical protein